MHCLAFLGGKKKNRNKTTQLLVQQRSVVHVSQLCQRQPHLGVSSEKKKEKKMAKDLSYKFDHFVWLVAQALPFTPSWSHDSSRANFVFLVYYLP